MWSLGELGLGDGIIWDVGFWGAGSGGSGAWGAGCRGCGVSDVGHWKLVVGVLGHWDSGLQKDLGALGTGQIPSPSAGACAPTSPRITLGLTRV